VKKVRLILVASLIFMCLGGCANAKASSEEIVTEAKPEATTSTVSAKKYYLSMKFESKAIAQNLVGEKSEKEVYVYLPPSYYDSDKKYPVIYCLHGFGNGPEGFLKSYITELDKMFKAGTKEFILVGVDGTNKAGGSFYANSVVTGNWEDYLVNEVVGLIDLNFRTINSSNSRGISGFSMGGFGAYNLALSHPDVFSSVFMMCPGLIADDELPIALKSWEGDTQFLTAYAQAFSPNVNDTVKFGDVPILSGTDEDNVIVQNWKNGFGNINKKVDTYISLKKPLKGIKIIYGEADSYKWIPSGCKYLAKVLDEKGIKYSMESFTGGHSIPTSVMTKYFIPFFNETLEY